MQSKQKANKEKAKNFAKEIVGKIGQMVNEHNLKVRRINNDNRAHKIIPVKGDQKFQNQFYRYLGDSAEKMKIMNGKMGESDRIKRQRRDVYSHKIQLMIGCMEQLAENKDVRVSIESNLVKWAQEVGQLADQIIKSLNLMQKQSFGCCFGGKKNTLYQVQKSLMELTGYYQLWLLLPKCIPQLQREIQEKYLELDYNSSIFFDLDKMIINDWPEPQIIEKQVDRIVEKLVVKQPSKLLLPEASFKEEAERRELADKYQRLQRECLSQKQLRQAHQMLIGLGRPQNISKAIDIYKSIPEMNQSDAKESIKSSTELTINPLICNLMGCLYEQGKYVPRDLKKAIEFYIKSASVDDSEGLYKIGRLIQKNLVNISQLFQQQYSNRKDEIKDAIEHYEKAAEKGHLDAITDLGHIYQNGIKIDAVRQGNSVVSDSEVSADGNKQFIVEPNLDYAVKYYQRAKKQEFPRALNNLGALYVKMGDKIAETMKGSNLERGIKYLKRATEQKYPKAFLNLGKCFEKGLGVRQNYEKAKAYYTQGAELGDNQCKLQLVRFLINGELKTQGKADAMIAEYLRQIITSDAYNTQALFLMGLLYQKGILVEKSPQHAYHYFSRSAKMEYPPGLTKMGDYYYSGNFVEKNLDRAKYYYQKASAKGSTHALINLGLMYNQGQVETESKSQQIQKANECFIEAAKLGDANALIHLNKDKSKQQQCVKQAAELGSHSALKILAKTSTTFEVGPKTMGKTKAEYGIIMNRLIKQMAEKPKINPKLTKQTEAPLSQKERQMLIYSPRSRPAGFSSGVSFRFNSPQSFRESSATRGLMLSH